MNQDRTSTITNSQLKEGYKQTEVGVIPEDWDVKLLGNISDIIMGQSPPGNTYNKSGTGIPLINGPTEFTQKYPVKAQWTTQSTKICRKDDLLLCVRGSSTGRINISNDEYCIGRGVAAIRALSISNTVFLTYQINSGIERLLALSTGSTFANVDSKSIRSIEIPLPPTKEEQEAIACTLSDIDALIESLDRLLTKKRQIKQGAMQELLRSKEGWVDKSLGEIGRCLRGVSYNPNTDIYSYDTDCTVRLLRSNNIQKSSLVFTDLQFVDSVRMSESQQLRSKDVVICMANGSKNLVGKAGKFSRTDEFIYTFGSFMGCFRGNEIVVDQDFVFYLFQTNKYKIHIANLLAGSSINNLCPSSIESFSIPIPSTLEEQIEIANILSDMDAEIDSISAKLTKTRQLKQGMMHELLTGRIRLID
jgi:type I restriction enzyme, S subunit